MVKLNGSQMILEALHEEGVDVVFGYPGGAALNIFDEIYSDILKILNVEQYEK